MPDDAPRFCRPIAFRLFQKAKGTLETDEGLALAAVALSMHELEDVQPAMIGQMIDGLACTVRERVHGNDPDALLAHLHELLFEELGFTGNTDDYFSPTNSYLPEVLVTKRGLPITLCLIYTLLARRLGLRSWGINAPGHFLAGVQINGKAMIIDPFHGGRMMTDEEAIEQIEQLAGQKVPEGVDALSTASHRQWIGRILRNLEAMFVRANRERDLAAMQELAELL
jgi:regulator of sirC expression with transglutaminase-like and TPR domain